MIQRTDHGHRPGVGESRRRRSRAPSLDTTGSPFFPQEEPSAVDPLSQVLDRGVAEDHRQPFAKLGHLRVDRAGLPAIALIEAERAAAEKPITVDGAHHFAQRHLRPWTGRELEAPPGSLDRDEQPGVHQLLEDLSHERLRRSGAFGDPRQGPAFLRIAATGHEHKGPDGIHACFGEHGSAGHAKFVRDPQPGGDR